MGLPVAGIDICPRSLEIAQQKLSKLGNAGPLKECDMRDLSPDTLGTFDVVTVLCSTLVLLPTLEDVEKALRAIVSVLNPQGIVVLDLPNHAVEIPQRDREQDHSTYRAEQGRLDLVERSYEQDGFWVEEWHGFIRGPDGKFSTFVETFQELVLTTEQIEAVLSRCGLQVLYEFASRSGKPFGEGASRHVYVCQVD
mmetsp:Transcript_41950/g.98491  ORF Transcript_41950/g.98491 Transcript_41950/m.98491 type:complete len:196 (+) Transcript_41950:206-793(+)